jgi:hypothetical protein
MAMDWPDRQSGMAIARSILSRVTPTIAAGSSAGLNSKGRAGGLYPRPRSAIRNTASSFLKAAPAGDAYPAGAFMPLRHYNVTPILANVYRPILKYSKSETIGASPMRARRIAAGVVLLLAAGLAAGCDPAADAKVDRINTRLASDLRVRGQLERRAVETQFESFRVTKRAEIAAAHDQALQALEALGKLDAKAARRASDRFGSMAAELDRQVATAKAIAVAQTAWFDTAADVVDATTEYRQTKDRALLEGGKAALEAFAGSYAATRKEPADESEAKAQGLMDQLSTQLRSMLEARLSAAP